MTTQTTKKLNPFAPEYNPIQAGVTPSAHAPAPFFLPPPQPRPQRRLLTYPSTSPQTRRQFHPTYHPTLQNQVAATPPSRAEARNGHLTRRGRGRGRERRGFESGRERESSWRVSRHEQFRKRGMHKVENRHQITPLNRDEEATTVMIKNIPYDCRRRELINMLDAFCLTQNQKARNEATSREEPLMPYAYDFLYLPIDFGTKKSRGFAFVNFTSSRAVWGFYDSIHLTNWGFHHRIKWQKRIEIVCAKIQGKGELMAHFSESIFECGTDEYLPVGFYPARDGSGQPVKQTVVGKRRPAARW